MGGRFLPAIRPWAAPPASGSGLLAAAVRQAGEVVRDALLTLGHFILHRGKQVELGGQFLLQRRQPLGQISLLRVDVAEGLLQGRGALVENTLGVGVGLHLIAQALGQAGIAGEVAGNAFEVGADRLVELLLVDLQRAVLGRGDSEGGKVAHAAVFVGGDQFAAHGVDQRTDGGIAEQSSGDRSLVFANLGHHGLFVDELGEGVVGLDELLDVLLHPGIVGKQSG